MVIGKGFILISMAHWDGTSLGANYTGDYDLAKTIIVKSSVSTSKMAKATTLVGLEENDVDIHDYQQVMDYYGLDY